MTFDDDFVQIRIAPGLPVGVSLRQLALVWPPPERIVLVKTEAGVQARDADTFKGDPDVVYHRTSMSPMSDEERSMSIHVARGAAYAAAIVRSPAVEGT